MPPSDPKSGYSTAWYTPMWCEDFQTFLLELRQELELKKKIQSARESTRPPWSPVHWPWNAELAVSWPPELHSHSSGLLCGTKQSNKAESRAQGSVTFSVSIPYKPSAVQLNYNSNVRKREHLCFWLRHPFSNPNGLTEACICHVYAPYGSPDFTGSQ